MKMLRRARTIIPGHARGKPIQLWRQGVANVGLQGSLTYVWAELGSRPRAPHDQRSASAYIFDAACPAHGVGTALVLPSLNIAARNLHLAEISAQVTPSAHAAITLDGAGWHRPSGALVVPKKLARFLCRRIHPR